MDYNGAVACCPRRDRSPVQRVLAPLSSVGVACRGALAWSRRHDERDGVPCKAPNRPRYPHRGHKGKRLPIPDIPNHLYANPTRVKIGNGKHGGVSRASQRHLMAPASSAKTLLQLTFSAHQGSSWGTGLARKAPLQDRIEKE